MYTIYEPMLINKYIFIYFLAYKLHFYSILRHYATHSFNSCVFNLPRLFS
jgi:hypothetical protein